MKKGGPDGTFAAAILLAASYCPALAAESLSDFKPSPLQSPHGVVSRVEFTSDLINLKPGALGFHAHELVRNLRFAEPVWIVAYRTDIFDSEGMTPPGNHVCHTFLGDQTVVQRDDQEGPLPTMKAIYTDSFTRDIQLPEGFGFFLTPQDSLEWMPMFNNRSDGSPRVGMRAEIDLIREADLKKPLRPLYSTLRSVKVPHLYFVPPGRDEQEVLFELPFDGRIHFVGAHVHPHAESIELFSVSRDEAVWKGHKKTDSAGSMVGMEVYSSVDGYPVENMDTFRLTAVYENPTDDRIDAMAGVFILYSLDR